eukprot:TRINITY_DN19112_c0_g1_i1.p1 TRINITY_DN19112_c0_g1~~TRINITY_DN19112_c0_g1_i1.p1  ORF type:complete len:965 (-),score=161.99 TRINITY_DN19112_c0_g1_i1:310-3204(-)
MRIMDLFNGEKEVFQFIRGRHSKYVPAPPAGSDPGLLPPGSGAGGWLAVDPASGRPAKEINRARFEFQHFLPLVGTDPLLRSYCITCVDELCKLQQRLAEGGAKGNDALLLCCEELKDWFISISNRQFHPDTKAEIDQRLQYITALGQNSVITSAIFLERMQGLVNITQEWISEVMQKVGDMLAHGPKVVIFSGFVDQEPGHREQDREMLAAFARFLGAEVASEFSFSVTHVISPPIRTSFVLKAFLGRCWVMQSAWITDSLVEGKWLDESAYGKRNHRKQHAFSGRRFFLSPAFAAEHGADRTQQCRNLLAVQNFVSFADADVALVGSNEDCARYTCPTLTWDTLLDSIFPRPDRATYRYANLEGMPENPKYQGATRLQLVDTVGHLQRQLRQSKYFSVPRSDYERFSKDALVVMCSLLLNELERERETMPECTDPAAYTEHAPMPIFVQQPSCESTDNTAGNARASPPPALDTSLSSPPARRGSGGSSTPSSPSASPRAAAAGRLAELNTLTGLLCAVARRLKGDANALAWVAGSEAAETCQTVLARCIGEENALVRQAVELLPLFAGPSDVLDEVISKQCLEIERSSPPPLVLLFCKVLRTCAAFSGVTSTEEQAVHHWTPDLHASFNRMRAACSDLAISPSFNSALRTALMNPLSDLPEHMQQLVLEYHTFFTKVAQCVLLLRRLPESELEDSQRDELRRFGKRFDAFEENLLMTFDIEADDVDPTVRGLLEERVGRFYNTINPGMDCFEAPPVARSGSGLITRARGASSNRSRTAQPTSSSDKAATPKAGLFSGGLRLFDSSSKQQPAAAPVAPTYAPTPKDVRRLRKHFPELAFELIIGRFTGCMVNLGAEVLGTVILTGSHFLFSYRTKGSQNRRGDFCLPYHDVLCVNLCMDEAAQGVERVVPPACTPCVQIYSRFQKLYHIYNVQSAAPTVAISATQSLHISLEEAWRTASEPKN